MFKTLQEALDAERQARAEAKALVDAAKAEERELAEGEAKQADDLLDKADAAKAEAETLREAEAKQSERKARLEANEMALQSPSGRKVRPEKVGASPRNYAREEIEHVKMFGKYVAGEGLSGQEQDHMRPRSERWGSDAQKGMRVPMSVARALLGLPVSAIPHLSTDADGGANLFDREYVQELLRLAPEPTTLLGRVRTVPTSTGEIRIPRLQQDDTNEYGGVSFDWIGEGAEKPETEVKLDQVPIVTHEAAGYTEVSHTLMRRSVFDLIGLLGQLFRDGMGDFMERAILTGTGSGQALGIVNTAGVREAARQSAGQIHEDDLVEMTYEMQEQHLANAVWVMQRNEMKGLELRKDAINRPLFRASMANGPYDSLIGYPFVRTTRLPAAGEDGSAWLIDLRQYWLAVEQEIVMRTSEHFQFRKNLEALSIYVVFGGRLVQPRAAVRLVDSVS